MRSLVLFLSAVMAGATANTITEGGTDKSKFLLARQKDDEKPESPMEAAKPVDDFEDTAAECYSNGCACQGEIEGIYSGNCWYNAGWAVLEMGQGGRPWHVYECKSRKCCDKGLHAKCNNTVCRGAHRSRLFPAANARSR